MHTTISPSTDGVNAPTSSSRTTRFRVVTVLMVALLATTCTSCKPFDTLDQFASLKYEAPARLAVVSHRSSTEVLYAISIKDGTTAARNVILGFAPKWNWSNPLCYVGGLSALGFCSYVSFIENRFQSDVRGRSDFWQSLSQAHAAKGCWTWSFTIPSSSNFTYRGASDSHCS